MNQEGKTKDKEKHKQLEKEITKLQKEVIELKKTNQENNSA